MLCAPGVIFTYKRLAHNERKRDFILLPKISALLNKQKTSRNTKTDDKVCYAKKEFEFNKDCVVRGIKTVIVFCLGVAVAGLFAASHESSMPLDSVYAMYVDGLFVGNTQNPQRGLECYNNACTTIGDMVNIEDSSANNIYFSLCAGKAKADNSALCDNLQNYLLSRYDFGYALYIDDELISINKSKEVVSSFTETIKEKAIEGAKLGVPGKVENVEIASQIKTVDGYFPKVSFKTNEYLYSLKNLLVEQKMMLRSVSTSATQARLSHFEAKKEIQQMPVVACDISYTTEEQKPIPYNVDYILDDSKPAGEVEIIAEGQDGIVSEITLTTLTSAGKTSVPYGEQILKAPVNGIISIGTAIQINSPAPSQDSGFEWPSDGLLYSKFGQRSGRIHAGIDICGPEGSIITAAKDGVVIFSGYKDNGYGNYIIIQHNDEETTLYSHNKSNSVEAGDYVVKGEEIAKMGMTGRASGNHVHFEIRINGVAKNPEDYLPARD